MLGVKKSLLQTLGMYFPDFFLYTLLNREDQSVSYPDTVGKKAGISFNMLVGVGVS